MPSQVRLIRSSALSDVAQYAYAATAPADARLIFLAGACPLALDGATVGEGDYAAQAARCSAATISSSSWRPSQPSWTEPDHA